MRYLLAGVLLVVSVGASRADEQPPQTAGAKRGVTASSGTIVWLSPVDDDPDEGVALRLLNHVLGDLTGYEIHPDPNYRVKRLLRESEELQKKAREWEEFWFKDKNHAPPAGDDK